MAIDSFTKQISFRLPKPRLRSKSRNTAASPPPGPRRSIGGGEIASTPRSGGREDEFRQVFAFLDTNSDGKISAHELRAYFASVGDAAAHDAAARIIGDVSGRGEGSDDFLLGFGEFMRVVELGEGEEEDAVLRRAFELYEVDKGSGRITAEGLRQVLRRIGVDVKSVEECRAMIGAYDLDGNGVLDFEEFRKMMMN